MEQRAEMGFRPYIKSKYRRGGSLYPPDGIKINHWHKKSPTGAEMEQRAEMAEMNRAEIGFRPYNWSIIIKGSGGDRGTRVYKANNLEEMEKLVRDLRKSETEEGKRYMLQEYIPNDGDYRVLVLGDKVLGVMKRSSQNKEEFRNNYSAGGAVEVADLPEEIKQLAVKAAKVCGLAVAGVDVAFREYDMKKPVIWEVNKGPQFKGFMTATGIDVPREIVKYLAGLKNEGRKWDSAHTKI
jgi:RimK family alpha-L-glutamate ligase